MIAKEFNKIQDLNILLKFFRNSVKTMRTHPYLVVLAIFTWALFMPSACIRLGLGPTHIRVAGFQVI